MSDAEIRKWMFWNERIGYTNHMARSPCEDCEADFAAEMRDEGRCDGVPGKADPNLAPYVSYNERRNEARIERMQEALDLYATGLSQVKVAKIMGLAPSTISKYVVMARREAEA